MTIFDMDGNVVSVERVGDRIILTKFGDDGPTTIRDLRREQALALAFDMLTHPGVTYLRGLQ